MWIANPTIGDTDSLKSVHLEEVPDKSLQGPRARRKSSGQAGALRIPPGAAGDWPDWKKGSFRFVEPGAEQTKIRLLTSESGLNRASAR